MGLLDSLKKEYCFYPVVGDDKHSVLSDLVSKFSSVLGYDGKREEEMLSAVERRETLGSTGLEQGVAIPHAKMASLEKPLVAVGVLEKEIDYGSVDGKATKVLFLVLGSDEYPNEHVQVLAEIAKLVKNSYFLTRILNVKSQKELQDLFFE